MTEHKHTILIIFILSLSFAGTPLEYAFQVTTGYDSNTMRLSQEEFRKASLKPSLLGGSDTFDSFVYRFGLSGNKSIWNSKKKELILSVSIALTDYIHNPNRKYDSGRFGVKYKWGPYKSIKYSIRYLDQFYLRHYVNRDISNSILASSVFSDRDQSIKVTQKISRRSWINLSTGFLQRYFEDPFSEFDLDIYYIRGKVDKRISKFGIVAFQLDMGMADNITYGKTAKASILDRSYWSTEWYVPVRIKYNIPILNEIGFSARRGERIYVAEDPEDPLHSGRSHIDMKYDLWLKKNITEDLNIVLTGRYRIRNTSSTYEWVEDLKSFQLFQLWFKVEWEMVYDDY
tara:strand:- start:36971 stop:38002 length:1032 start_codon:yes stop_codon:yes gene_type:complete